MRLLEHGPSLGLNPGAHLTTAQAEQQVRLWIQSWVIPEVEALVPEFREALALRDASQIIVNAKEKQCR
jgi:hypothetical protein